MAWNSINAYEDFMANLAVPPVQKMEPQDFTVWRAPMTGMNSPTQLGSTFIQRVRYLPMAGQAFITIGNGNYLYPMTQVGLANWMKSQSLGRFYNNYIKLK